MPSGPRGSFPSTRRPRSRRLPPRSRDLTAIADHLRSSGDLEEQGIVESFQSWETRTHDIQVGDGVWYSGDWLKRTGGDACWMGQLRSTVVEIKDTGKPYARAIIDRDGEEDQERIVLQHLEKVNQRGEGR